MEWDAPFAEFVRQQSGGLFGKAWLLVGDKELAADLVQETLTRLYPKWDLVLNADAPVAYVRAALTRQFLSEARRYRAPEVPITTIREPSFIDLAGDPDDRLILMRQLSRVSARQRAAVVLRYFEDLDDRAAAQVMGCPVATFRSHVRRGLSALRAEMVADDEVETQTGRKLRSAQ